MTNRARIVDTLRCLPTDRPPLPMWLGFTPWEQTLSRWREESGIADLDVSSYFGFEDFFESVPLEYGPLPRFTARVIASDEEFVTSVDDRGITVRNRRDGMSMPEWIDHPVKSPDDWKRYKEERLSGPRAPRLATLEEFVRRMAARDLPIQLGAFPWGLFGTLRDLVGTERSLVWFYDEPDTVRDIIDTNVELWLRLYAEVTERIAVDHIHIWEDMSGRQGSLISMAMVDEFMMPGYERIVAFAKGRGIPIVSVDTDGLVEELVPVMARHGINAFMPFEAQAGNSITSYRSRFPGLGIMGGLDKRALARSRAEVNRELDKAERMFASGGYIVGFDHAIPPDVSWESYRYAVSEIRKMVFRGGTL